MANVKRLFIEIDPIKADELETWATSSVLMHGLPDDNALISTFFDTVIDCAYRRGAEVWDAVKTHDEIYASTALIPRGSYGGSTGAGALFNQLMDLSIKEKITGKKIFILRSYDEVMWDQLEPSLIKKALQKNDLFVQRDYDTWEKINVAKLLKLLASK